MIAQETKLVKTWGGFNPQGKPGSTMKESKLFNRT